MSFPNNFIGSKFCWKISGMILLPTFMLNCFVCMKSSSDLPLFFQIGLNKTCKVHKCILAFLFESTRGGVFEDVLGLEDVLEDTFWSPWLWPWPRSLKSLAFASKPQVLENCPVLGSRTALFFEQLKFLWKTPETSLKICEHLFCFLQLEHRRRQGEGGRASPDWNFTNDKNVTKKPTVSAVSVSF